MRNILALFGLALVAFVGVGYFQGWYSVQTSQTAPGKRNVSIDLNEEKITDDLRKGGQKVGEKISSVLDKKESATP